MGNVNTIPVVSQAKSAVQAACGDTRGARETQEKFLHECVGVSQVTSLVYLAKGDTEKAEQTQVRCGKTLSNFADGVPVVGHVKGAIHHIAGDHEGGNNALRAATRTTGVMAGGALGFCVGGPVGAVAGGIAAGGTLDGAATLTSSVLENEYKPEGIFANVQQVIDNPSGGAVFDALAVPVFDGLAGYQGGKIASALENAAAGKAPTIDPKAAAEAAETRGYANQAMAVAEEMRETPGVTTGQLLKQYEVAMALDKQATLIETGGRGAPPAFDPKVSSGPNLYPPGVQDSGKQKEKSTEQSQDSFQATPTRETTASNSTTSTKVETPARLTQKQLDPSPKFACNVNLFFGFQLKKVLDEFKRFDQLEEYDLSVLEEKVQKLLKGKGVEVVRIQKIFTKMMLYDENEKQNLESKQVVSVMYGKATAELYDKENPLRGYQVVMRHQSDRMGALHILLSHPQDMFDLLPGLDVNLFPPNILFFLGEDMTNIISEKPRRKLDEVQKAAMVTEAQLYYLKHPEERKKMMANELLLVTFLRMHMNPSNFSLHQFYSFKGKQKFRVVFNVPTTFGEKRQLAIGLSCDPNGSGKAIIYKSPGRDGIDCDCYEIITAFVI